MKLICPACGATASFETWVNDSDCRQMMAELVRLPAPLPSAAIGYIALFRSSSRALGWKKALRLVGEIRELTAAGSVKVQGMPPRSCPPHIWAQAMEVMCGQRERLKLPMPNHNYLRKVAYDLAEPKYAHPRQERPQAQPIIRRHYQKEEMSEEQWQINMENIKRIREMAGKIGNVPNAAAEVKSASPISQDTTTPSSATARQGKN